MVRAFRSPSNKNIPKLMDWEKNKPFSVGKKTRGEISGWNFLGMAIKVVQNLKKKLSGFCLSGTEERKPMHTVYRV